MKKFSLFCITILTIFLSSQVSFAGKEKYGIFRRFMKTPRTMNIVSNICLGKKVPIKEVKPGRPIKDGYEIQFMYNLSGCTGVVARMAIGEYGGKIIIIDYSNRDTEYYYLLDELSDSSFGAINVPLPVATTPDTEPEQKDQPKPTIYDIAPGKVLRIVDASFNDETEKFNIVTENETERQKFPFFIICTYDFLYTPSKKVASCRNPYMIVSNQGTRKIGYKGGMCERSRSRLTPYHGIGDPHECAEIMKSQGFLIRMDADDYMVAAGIVSLTDSLFIFSGNTNIKKGDQLKLCDSRGDFVLDNTGKIVKCETVDEIEIDDFSEKAGLFTSFYGAAFFVTDPYHAISH